MTPLPVMSFTIEEITGCTNEAAKGANTALIQHLLAFFLSHVTLFSVTASINTPESSSDFVTLMIHIFIRNE